MPGPWYLISPAVKTSTTKSGLYWRNWSAWPIAWGSAPPDSRGINKGPQGQAKMLKDAYNLFRAVIKETLDGLDPRSKLFIAGHSLGEYSAHVAAGTLAFSDAVRTVRNRGRYMQEAVPVGEGAMAAILALPGSEWTRVWDGEAQVPYMRRTDGTKVISYDDMSSVGLKCQYVKDKASAGVIIWELGGDFRSGHAELLEVIGKSFGAGARRD